MYIKEDKLCACVLNVMKPCTRTQIISLLKHYRIVIQLCTMMSLGLEDLSKGRNSRYQPPYRTRFVSASTSVCCCKTDNKILEN